MDRIVRGWRRAFDFYLHCGRQVRANTGEIVGMTGQAFYDRQPRVESENRFQRTQRRREEEVWGRLIDKIGRVPPGTPFRHRVAADTPI